MGEIGGRKAMVTMVLGQRSEELLHAASSRVIYVGEALQEMRDVFKRGLGILHVLFVS